MAAPREGVIRFSAQHTPAPPDPAWTSLLPPLFAWRRRLFEAGLIGRDPARYGGAGFGNASARYDSGFVVTGTQTGGRPELTAEDLSQVDHWDPVGNRVVSRGPIEPSSESMTHGAVYDARPDVRFVLHGHSPDLWQGAAALGLPTTDPAIEYGTPEMHDAVREVVARDRSARLLVMGGHEDGILAWGPTPDEAGEALLEALERVRSLPNPES